MKRAGFSFAEALAALAVLTLVSVSLMPLLAKLAQADRGLRDQAEAWRAAQTGLTALYLNDARLWEEAGERTGFRLVSDTEITPAGTAWKTVTVFASGAETRPALRLFLSVPKPAGVHPQRQ